jgi:hypothetical protein
MAGFVTTRRMAAAAAVAALAAFAPPAQAGDFFSSLFGGSAQPAPASPPVSAMPYASESASPAPADVPSTPRVASGGTAFCVRTCDGRYFPVPAAAGQSKAATCKSLCPASETKVYTGGTIDSASSADSGKSYSSLPNAFRYRTELVNGCTCNGRDSGGLAHINVENDPTLRKGDLVAGADGALVASRGGDKRDAAATRVDRPIRLTFGRVPVMAAQ